LQARFSAAKLRSACQPRRGQAVRAAPQENWEISPPIPQEYADYFKVNGMLMPDYTIEGEEPPQQQQAAAIPENTGQEKEREHMSEQFSIMIM